MTWPQGYRLMIFAKTGTFPKSGDDHNKPAIGGELLKRAGDNDLAQIAGLGYLADKL